MLKNKASVNNIAIVGAGVAGLSCGIYARRSGFNVTIYEKHINCGGLSSSWMRGGYLFEGGMHWLTGSLKSLAINRVWREVGALKENNPIYFRDPFYVLKDYSNDSFIENKMKDFDKNDGKLVSNNADSNSNLFNSSLPLYRDLKKMRDTFLQYAPEDKKMILQLYSDIKSFLPIHIVISDIPRIKTRTPLHPGLLELIKMAAGFITYLKLINVDCLEYIHQFKNKNIQHLLLSVVGYRYNAMSFIYTMASFMSGDCGYPLGGSRVMVSNMLDTYLKLGGEIKYKSLVSKVLIKDKKAVGLIVNDSEVKADAVIVTQDALQAASTLFGEELNKRLVSKAKKNIITEQNMSICLGVKTDLTKYPGSIIFPLKTPLQAGGLTFTELRVNHYAHYKGYAPEGSTSLTLLLLGDSYKYWKKAREDGSYKEKKDSLARSVIEELERFIPEIKGKIEVVDVATPLTCERYCNSYEGSWMSVWKAKRQVLFLPIKSVSVKSLYFAGQRVIPPGGLPCTVYSARQAVQYLCRDNRREFVSQ